MPNDVRGPDLLAQISWNRRQFLKKIGKTGLALSSVPAVLSLIEACASGGGTTTASGPVDFWTYRQQDVDLFNLIIKQIHGPNLKVNMGVATEFDAQVLTAMQANAGPDLFRGRAGLGFYRPYAKAKQLLVLNDLIPDLKKNFPQTALDATSVDGQIYAVPSNLDVTQFTFNKKVVGDLSTADGPATWDELMAFGEKVKKSGVPFIFLATKDAWPLQFVVAGIAATDLPNDYVSDLLAGKAKFSDPLFVGVLQKLKDLTQLAQPGYQAGTYNDMMAAIGKGTAAGTLLGSWVPVDLKVTIPDIQVHQFLVPPNRAGGQRQAAYFYDGTWAVNANGKNKDGALKLARASATAQTGQLQTDIGEIADMASMTHPTVKDPNLARTLVLAEHLMPKTWWQFSAFDAGVPGINSLLPPAAQAVVTGQLTPRQAADNIQKGLASWFKFT